MNKIKNGLSYNLNGWLYISVRGSPREIGYAHGYLAAAEMKEIQTMLRFNVLNDTGNTWDYYVDVCKHYMTPTIMEHFPEIYEELQGLAEGCNAAGTSITLEEMIAWNNYISLLGYWHPPSTEVNDGKTSSKEGGGAADRCSAFIANGDYTTDGKIICAHNSFCTFVDGQYYNVIIDIQPTNGYRILMQSCPCWVWSGSDFFVTSRGIIGTETTIGGFSKFENKYPIFCRIRKAMQYGDTLDDYVKILLDGNSGDYANSWLFGDTNTNEIMDFELGLRYHNVKRTKNGYFFGCNLAFDPRIRNLECGNTGYCDIRRHQGSRQVRLPDLMDTHKGKMNIEVAQKLIADHFDVYLQRENPCSRTVCSHYNLDPREFMSQSDRPKPFHPKGAMDGAVIDTTMAKNMSFSMRWGSSCGMPFDKNVYCDEHRQFAYLRPYLHDRPAEPWTVFTITGSGSMKRHITPRKKRHGAITRKHK